MAWRFASKESDRLMSYLAWLDHSEHERRKMLDVIDLFREHETVDELGIGTVRDAFADLMFPGTSTIQSRARYFLFIPWIYVNLEAKGVGSKEIAARARREEVALIEALVESGEGEGVIGVEARERLRRLPSAVYWNGLALWGVRRFHGPQDQYHRSLDRFYRLTGRQATNDDGEPIEGGLRRNWDAGLPPAPAGFPKGAKLSLLYNLMLAERRRDKELEEQYLRDLEKWAERIAKEPAIAAWDQTRFWQIAAQGGGRIGPRAQGFITHWLALALPDGKAKGIAKSKHARQLIEQREKALKGEQSRLSNQRALERWSGAAGTGQIDYRWGITQTILLDILEGRGVAKEHA